MGQILIHTASTGPTPSLTDVYAVEISLGGEKWGLLATDLEVAAAEDLHGSGVEGCSVGTSWDSAYWSMTA